MILDAVTFHSIEMEIAHGIAHGGATMGETMHTMTAAIMSMPVVKKIRPFAVWCGWVCQVVTVLRSSLPQVR